MDKEKSDVEARDDTAVYNSRADELILSIAENPDAGFVKVVEDSLRHLYDFNLLGESALVGLMGVVGKSHVERGQALYQTLIEAVEALRPSANRPKQPLPCVWYNYVVLYDAYV